MVTEGRAAAEGLPTFHTLIGFLPSVDAEVADEVNSVAEGFPVLFALKGFLSGVGPFVQDERRTVGEGFATLTAHKGLLPSVDHIVVDQGCTPHTHCTHRAPFLCESVGATGGMTCV